ncbi:MAG: flagellar hook-associated protein FlgK [Deltaproteobacteria bacterium]|nr:flagellar hook-associated protein FlgK [Deltaproteobacteria bacterium]
MAGLFDALGITGGALMTHEYGIQVTGHNISNVATPGYHRQVLGLSARGPATLGVTDAGVQRVADSILGRRLAEERAAAGYADTRADALAVLEALLAELGDTGLGAALDSFFGAWRELASAPQDLPARAAALAATDSLAARVRQVAADTHAAQVDADHRVRVALPTVNTRLDAVAALNRSIAINEAAGSAAPDLRDQREQALQDLALLIGAQSFEDDRGQVAVSVAGVTLVQGDAVRHLTTVPDATTGFVRLTTADAAQVDLTRRLTGGELGGQLALRDRDLAGLATALDAFAFDLATAVNAVHQGGVGADGVSGRALFAPPAAVSGAAAALALDAAVASAPDHLAAAQVAGAAGDGRNASSLATLDQALVANGGQLTLGASLAANLAAIGALVADAVDAQAEQAGRLSALETLRESQSGVSLEEQMLMLDRYQRAFQAASRVLSKIDEMFDSLLSM